MYKYKIGDKVSYINTKGERVKGVVESNLLQKEVNPYTKTSAEVIFYQVGDVFVEESKLILLD